MGMEPPQFQGMLLLLLPPLLFTLSCTLARIGIASHVVGQYYFLQFVVVCVSSFIGNIGHQKNCRAMP